MNFPNPHQVGKIADFGIAVAGNQEDAVDLMARPEMLHKTAPFGPRNVAKPECGGVLAVNENDAFQAGGNFRKRHTQIGNFLASRDPHLMFPNNAQQPFALALTHFQDRIERKICPRGGIENRASQRMLGITLQARRRAKDVAFATPGAQSTSVSAGRP